MIAAIAVAPDAVIVVIVVMVIVCVRVFIVVVEGRIGAVVIALVGVDVI